MNKLDDLIIKAKDRIKDYKEDGKVSISTIVNAPSEEVVLNIVVTNKSIEYLQMNRDNSLLSEEYVKDILENNVFTEPMIVILEPKEANYKDIIDIGLKIIGNSKNIMENNDKINEIFKILK